MSGRKKPEDHYRGGLPFAGLVKKARQLRRRQTPAEGILWHILRDRQFLGLKFRRQHQFSLYIPDFYCHQARLVIELDGGVHEDPESQQRDRWRNEALDAFGLTVVRLPNELIFDDPAEALRRIQAAAQAERE